MKADAPHVESACDLRPLCEHFTINEDGDYVFLHSMFALVTEAYVVYFGRLSIRKFDLTPEMINKSLKRVPDEDVYPEAPLHITRAVEVDDNLFVKGPMLTALDELGGSGEIAKALLQEAEILELLERNRHPNIVRYCGCQVQRGRIVGIVLERYPCTLEQRMGTGVDNLDLESGFGGIESAVRHLHSLGLAHNDIKPSNVMVDASNTWILIDMGSCRPFGETLTVAGTPGWDDGEYTTSAKQNDEAALGKLWTWLADANNNKFDRGKDTLVPCTHICASRCLAADYDDGSRASVVAPAPLLAPLC